ncbi:hypothetical protein [Burkholderia ubonensis]|uniref:hypothetical protein n=1 Tax=Burkholderia ubonensis TaxID=101571 RepID=UPI0012FA3F29|nr:hypothetical protein [Burkholderia ubonensis]
MRTLHATADIDRRASRLFDYAPGNSEQRLRHVCSGRDGSVSRLRVISGVDRAISMMQKVPVAVSEEGKKWKQESTYWLSASALFALI